jgi:hypothetical protein
VPVLLESGQVLLSELERELLRPAALSLRESAFDVPALTGPIALADYWSLVLRDAMLQGDNNFVSWALQRLEHETLSRQRSN